MAAVSHCHYEDWLCATAAYVTLFLGVSFAHNIDIL
jgi:hypothetical protein